VSQIDFHKTFPKQNRLRFPWMYPPPKNMRQLKLTRNHLPTQGKTETGSR